METTMVQTVTCSECNGEGGSFKSFSKFFLPCEICHGTGLEEVVEAVDPSEWVEVEDR